MRKSSVVHLEYTVFYLWGWKNYS